MRAKPMQITLPALGTVALLALAACGDTGMQEAPAADRAPPNVLEQACLIAVADETGNQDVVLKASEPVTGGTSVLVGVGPTQAPWQCIARSDGSTGNIMFMGDEGAL